MHAQIDGDVICYACGFASDAAAANKLRREIGDENYDRYVEDEGKPFEPFHNARHGVNEKLNAIRNIVDATRQTIFISHPVNFREQLYPPYKMNRATDHKPHWYNEIKDYLFEKGAVFSDVGDEADDAMGIAQTEMRRKGKASIICTIDKDLDMVPGLHYNWSKTKHDLGVYEVDEIDGLRMFYTQLITGDGTDNIPGIFQHKGVKAMPKLKDPLQSMYSEREMYQHVLDVYENDEEFVRMIAPLLWIKRYAGEVWAPPT